MRCLVASLLSLTLAAVCTAATPPRQLAFSWPKPLVSSTCDLRDAGTDGKGQPRRFAGEVERNDSLGIACSVQIARRKFDAIYRFCNVSNVDAVPREHYACLVVYSPTSVTFVYSYTEDLYGAPACEFACAPR